MFVGETGVGRVIERTCQAMKQGGVEDPYDVAAVRKLGVVDLPTIQKKANLHFTLSLDLFGSEVSTNAANFYNAGLKGRFQVLAVSEKEHYSFNACVARRLSYPPRYSEKRMSSIVKTATTVVESLGLEDGISHAEYRLQDDVPHLIEVAARGGGNRIASCIVPHVSGIDMYQLLIRRLSGEEIQMPPRKHRSAVLEFLDFAPGTVKAVHGLDEARSEGLAREIQLAFRPSDTILQPSDDRRRLGYAIVLGENRDEVDAHCARIRELVRVEYA